MIFSKPSFAKALENAYQALKTGKKNELRFWARKAIEIKPQDERPWLLLAAIATPKASLEYLQKALKINPNSKEAQKGIAWSKKRIEKEKKHPGGASRRGSSSQKKIKARTRRFSSAFIFPLTIILLLMSSGFVAGFAGPPAAPVNVSQTPTATMTTIPNTLTATTEKPTLEPTQEIISSPTEEPTQHRFISDRSTLTASPTNTATITPTPTATFTASATFTPTATSPPTETYTPPPPPPTFTSAPSNGLPAGVGTNDIWVDVNLSQQSMTVYRGHTALDSFLVSTGMWSTPTVVGTFQVYTMLTAQTMVGPGYFLPDVPYVMYFYQGYALHGTYWHSNFGTQMSHGCVNMRTSEAGWLFNLVQIGTVVNVHY